VRSPTILEAPLRVTWKRITTFSQETPP
jgi:hypothetical protein